VIKLGRCWSRSVDDRVHLKMVYTSIYKKQKRGKGKKKKKKLKEKRQIQKQLFKEQECGEEPGAGLCRYCWGETTEVGFRPKPNVDSEENVEV
jgi:hypothetical protein